MCGEEGRGMNRRRKEGEWTREEERLVVGRNLGVFSCLDTLTIDPMRGCSYRLVTVSIWEC